jgi:2-keto-4-pentenoate hydratase/2-oxohepta-3-ene-1,7-dioic acid hydratase in catechol pathway
MRIARLETTTGSIVLAAEHPEGKLTRLEGDLFGDLVDTGEGVEERRRLAPLVPADIFCIGLNYAQHAAEGNQPIPEHPVLFMKSRGTLANPGDPILLPRKLRSDKVDYECELAVVIARDCKNVRREEALDYVLGYTCANDVSARDWQRNGGGGQWVRGKTFATFSPLGPVLVTRDEIPDPNNLAIRTRLNGEFMQDWTTSDMIFDVPRLIEFLSSSTTLLAGTVIFTGTPHGVGFARNPPVYLQPGDEVVVEIESIGALVNSVAEEPV